MANILIIYSTTDGHTLKICHRLKHVIEQQNHQVTLMPIGNVQSLDLNSFDKIVVGASIRHGKHGRQVYEFIKRNKSILDSKPSAFFSVNLVARKPEKNQPDTNPYLKKFLEQVSWQPAKSAVFAGKIDYKKYHMLDKLIIRLIMWMTKGPTDPNTVIEFTNWNQVDDFGQIISTM